MFKSTINSISFYDHAANVFGRNVECMIKSESWGDVLIILSGVYKGAYDIYSERGEVTFIAA